MGNKKRRLQAFLREHPTCCYCGGMQPATTEDHWPPRSVFDERKWPAGYVFPACQRCQQATPDDEALFALLCRITAPGDQPIAYEATYRLMMAMKEKEPEIYRSFLPSANEKRRWFRDHGASLPPGVATTEIPILSLKHPEVKAKLRRCAAKLFLSLHYHHTKKILPAAGGMVLAGFSNAVSIEEAGLELLANMTTKVPHLRWQQVDVTAQFNYRYNADTEDGSVSVFMGQFNNGIGFGAICVCDLSRIPDIANETFIRPFGVL